MCAEKYFHKKTSGSKRPRPDTLLCTFFVCDVLFQKIQRLGRELVNHAIEAVPFDNEPPPVGIAALVVSSPVVSEAAIPIRMVGIMTFFPEKETEKNVVDLLRRGGNQTADFVFALFDDQGDADCQMNRNANRDDSTVVVLEGIRQRAGVRKMNLSFMCAVQLDLACVQRKSGEIRFVALERGIFNVHCCRPPSKCYQRKS